MDPHKKNLQGPENRSSLKSHTVPVTCLRCGTCCEKGGPSFHQEDRQLIEKGQVPSTALYTIRKGEYVYDNVKGCRVQATTDIIKIKGQKGDWTCFLFDSGKKTCSIYHNRPLECRRLKCWNTDALEQIYTRNRLTREDFISQVKGLWDLVVDHQVRCGYEKIEKLINNLDDPQKGKARQKLMEIIQYDAEIRKLVVEKGGLDPAMLDFIFGRPLTETLPGYGIKVLQEGEKTIIKRTS
jgi:Fe-S-cluster containining protein